MLLALPTVNTPTFALIKPPPPVMAPLKVEAPLTSNVLFVPVNAKGLPSVMVLTFKVDAAFVLFAVILPAAVNDERAEISSTEAVPPLGVIAIVLPAAPRALAEVVAVSVPAATVMPPEKSLTALDSVSVPLLALVKPPVLVILPPKVEVPLTSNVLFALVNVI